MALKTDYKAFIAPETGRRFHQTPNSDGTVTMTDVTEYTQEGDYYGPETLNTTNAKVNEIDSALATRAILGVGAGAHNSIYGGRFLGNAVTGEQYAAIADGSFTDMYIGDYWTIGGVNYRIAAFDYFYNVGDNPLLDHHAVIVPDTILYNATMNATNITTGGYAGSVMRATNLATAKTTIKTAFNGHVVNHRDPFVNAVNASGQASGWAWFDSEVELMNEVMVYGSTAWGVATLGSGYNVGTGKSQLPLFALRPDLVTNRDNWWLRDVGSDAGFAYVNAYGDANYYHASTSLGVRPAFSIS